MPLQRGLTLAVHHHIKEKARQQTLPGLEQGGLQSILDNGFPSLFRVFRFRLFGFLRSLFGFLRTRRFGKAIYGAA
ncbi:MAG: hypothetical protein C4567_01400 [Deltaproteobacteria bacterium]|nr:MAG: hypothetical protein C4567_01400 [Deltaproteobacteria bacterium]